MAATVSLSIYTLLNMRKHMALAAGIELRRESRRQEKQRLWSALRNHHSCKFISRRLKRERRRRVRVRVRWILRGNLVPGVRVAGIQRPHRKIVAFNPVLRLDEQQSLKKVEISRVESLKARGRGPP